MLTKENGGPYFEKLKSLLNEHFHHFQKEEMMEMHLYAINFCIRKIREKEERYVEEALNIYLKTIEDGLLFEHGYLSPWTYKNVVKFGLGLNRFDWTENFIHKYNKSLATSFQKDALQFNLADLYYYKNDLGKALEHLRNVEFSDIYYTLGAKVILLKIYFPSNEMDLKITHH